MKNEPQIWKNQDASETKEEENIIEEEETEEETKEQNNRMRVNSTIHKRKTKEIFKTRRDPA